ncbi:transposase [Pseudomonas kermanshahensis]|uniref:Transposase n=1 Tax=Pseudomonas kermanshahensis TaxID=2745482 RepID=A0ABU8R1C6_9PSED|nr:MULTISPECIES: transposase [Pseudomonas]MBC3485783.1 transposase [Pseudomonas sp. SWRI50]MBC3496943.1 transposase [Pseudomonas sp. SWRI67]MBV4527647.1 transposase [Pseudomonas kermanshahensis]
MEWAEAKLLRRGRFSEPGRLYLLTTVTHQRKPLFASLLAARLVIGQMRHSEREDACQSLAWVVMPDHLHWLIELHTNTLCSLMRQFKSRSGTALCKAGVSRGQVWQRGYHDRALRKDDDVRKIARYIVANPLRAGLVEHIGDYPHWDAVWLTADVTDPLNSL